MDFNARAKEIIEQNIYLTMSTSDKQGNPWISPVYCAYDGQYNFYWTSNPNARHSKNIQENDNKIAFIVFNSSVAEGTGEGVYFEGKAYEMSDEKEMAAALQLYYSRKNKLTKPAGDFLGESPRRLYKAVPERAWMNTDEKINGYIVDAKIEVKLK
jgi:nitroimidazol reductase NimA-like FMN-containing flavoprotein (pyridoxamine 5'-phosphate oxidase superfamily)